VAFAVATFWSCSELLPMKTFIKYSVNHMHGNVEIYIWKPRRPNRKEVIKHVYFTDLLKREMNSDQKRPSAHCFMRNIVCGIEMVIRPLFPHPHLNLTENGYSTNSMSSVNGVLQKSGEFPLLLLAQGPLYMNKSKISSSLFSVLTVNL
jgi:hypothetical protein